MPTSSAASTVLQAHKAIPVQCQNAGEQSGKPPLSTHLFLTGFVIGQAPFPSQIFPAVQPVLAQSSGIRTALCLCISLDYAGVGTCRRSPPHGPQWIGWTRHRDGRSGKKFSVGWPSGQAGGPQASRPGPPGQGGTTRQ
eukprot:gene22461-biopygen5750